MLSEPSLRDTRLNTHPQMILPLETKHLLGFDDFVMGDNAFSVDALQSWSTGFIFLQGGEGSGKTHLGEAVAKAMLAAGQKPVFLSGKQTRFYDSLTHFQFANGIILDDFEALFPAALADEEALFHFYNALLAKGHHLLIMSRQKPAQLGIQLPDLLSRLQSGLQLHLKSVTGDALMEVLKRHEQRLSLSLSEEVRHYLLTHGPRDPNTLIRNLEHLALESFKAKHKLTLPYVKSHYIFATRPISARRSFK